MNVFNGYPTSEIGVEVNHHTNPIPIHQRLRVRPAGCSPSTIASSTFGASSTSLSIREVQLALVMPSVAASSLMSTYLSLL